MNEMINHRGPDQSGYLKYKNLLLGHVRLSVLDISDKGRQPMSVNGQHWIIFNGEVYNYKEIKEDLIKKNYKFHSKTDTEVVLNLKKIRLKQQIEDENFEKVKISISNQETLKASDIGKNLSNFQVLNPDLVICNLNKSVNLNLELTIGKGRGYVTAEEHESIDSPIGTIFLDSIFTPVKNVKYHIENYRVDKKTD